MTPMGKNTPEPIIKTGGRSGEEDEVKDDGVQVAR